MYNIRTIFILVLRKARAVCQRAILYQLPKGLRAVQQAIVPSLPCVTDAVLSVLVPNQCQTKQDAIMVTFVIFNVTS